MDPDLDLAPGDPRRVQQRRPSAPLGAGWVAGKFLPPSTTRLQVIRASLSARLLEAEGALALVRSPAGFGKTTLMNQARLILEERGVASAWINLDRSDNDISRFLQCLDQAAESLGLIERPAHSTPFTAADPWRTAQAPFALFLDDFENVHEAVVLGVVREIVEHAPRRGHIVIGSRALPQLGIARLRAQGRLVEIEADSLRFTPEDAQTYFQQLGADGLTPSMVRTLNEKTEGWAAALWLAHLALDRRQDKQDFIDRFSGSERAIADYLAEEVVSRQSSEVQAFLLRTSILRELDPSVCAALLPDQDAAALLERMDALTLFLIPLENQTRAFRYHSLFADYLRRELTQRMPQEIERLHRAAAAWFEAQARPIPAIDHALEADDHAYGLSLLEQHAEDFLQRGRMRLLARWFAVIPQDLLRRHPQMEMVAAWAVCFTRGAWDAATLVNDILARHPDNPVVQAHAACIRPLLLTMQDRNTEALAAGRASLKQHPTGHPFADNTLLSTVASLATVLGADEEARQLLQAARRDSDGASTFQHMYAETTEGLLDLQAGRLRQATARFRLAIEATHAVSYNHSQGNAWPGVFFAYAMYETDRLDEASHLLSVYLPLAREVGLPDHMILSHAMQARIAFTRGDVDKAFAILTELEYVGHTRKAPRAAVGARLERSRLYLLQGNASAARGEMLKANDPSVWAREPRERMFAHEIEYPALADIRWTVHFGDSRTALERVEPELTQARADRRQRRVLLLSLLRCMALARSGDPAEAMTQLGHTLQELAHEGFMRLALDEGPMLGRLLKRYQTHFAESLRQSPIVADYLQRLLRAFGPAVEDAAPAEAHEVPLPEPLTRKEVRVLTLLAEGYSNSAMAEKLFVSDSTVRTHLRGINAKLGASSRTEAVAIARRLGLLP